LSANLDELGLAGQQQEGVDGATELGCCAVLVLTGLFT
jgi:hypothetical protein